MRILIAQKKNILASALAGYLRSNGYQVTICPSIDQTPLLIGQHNPEILIIDYYLHPNGLLQHLKDISRVIPYTPIIILTPRFPTLAYRNTSNLEIKGFLHYDDDLDSLLECISNINAAKCYLSSKFLKEMEDSKKSLEAIDSLSVAEKEIVRRLILGESSKEIASATFRSIETIQNHRKNIKYKLGIKGGKSSFVNYLRKLYN